MKQFSPICVCVSMIFSIIELLGDQTSSGLCISINSIFISIIYLHKLMGWFLYLRNIGPKGFKHFQTVHNYSYRWNFTESEKIICFFLWLKPFFLQVQDCSQIPVSVVYGGLPPFLKKYPNKVTEEKSDGKPKKMKKGTKTLSVNSMHEPDCKYFKINILVLTKVTKFSVTSEKQTLSLSSVSVSQPGFTCSKLTIEMLEQGVKYVQS